MTRDCAHRGRAFHRNIFFCRAYARGTVGLNRNVRMIEDGLLLDRFRECEEEIMFVLWLHLWVGGLEFYILREQ